MLGSFVPSWQHDQLGHNWLQRAHATLHFWDDKTALFALSLSSCATVTHHLHHNQGSTCCPWLPSNVGLGRHCNWPCSGIDSLAIILVTGSNGSTRGVFCQSNRAINAPGLATPSMLSRIINEQHACGLCVWSASMLVMGLPTWSPGLANIWE